MMSERLLVAHVEARLGEKYRVDIQAGHHALTADEPVRLGGGGAGPAPYDLLLSSLAACTSITLRMYAERKGWPLQGLSVELRFSRDGEEARIDRTIVVQGPLDEAARTRLAEIAERTPVTLTLKSGVEILTELRG